MSGFSVPDMLTLSMFKAKADVVGYAVQPVSFMLVNIAVRRNIKKITEKHIVTGSVYIFNLLINFPLFL